MCDFLWGTDVLTYRALILRLLLMFFYSTIISKRTLIFDFAAFERSCSGTASYGLFDSHVVDHYLYAVDIVREFGGQVFFSCVFGFAA